MAPRVETPFTVAAAALAVVTDAFVACGLPIFDADEPGTPGMRTLVAVGGIVVDNCCDGLLIVAPERVYRSLPPFPNEMSFDPEGDAAEVGLIGVDLLVYCARCVPVLDDRGNPPPVAEQEAAYADILRDAAIVWGAVTSDAVLGDNGAGWALWERANVSQIYTQAEGGCSASETRFTLGVNMRSWCPPCELPEP